MSQDENMDPGHSPTGSVKTGVRRVNNWPLIILGVIGAAFLGIIGLVAADRAEQQNKPASEEAKAVGYGHNFAENMTKDVGDGVVPAQVLVPPPVETMLVADAPPPAAPTTTPPPPPPPGENGTGVVDEEARRIRDAKIALLEQSIKANTSVNSQAPRSNSSSGVNSLGDQPSQEQMLSQIRNVRALAETQRETDPMKVYAQRMAQLKGSGLLPTGAGSGSSSQGIDTLNSAAASPMEQGSGTGSNNWKLKTKVEAPGSDYELRAGFVIPGTLISGINSELPGQIVGQVSQNVYDTPTGKHLLIPTGSRLIGSYNSDVKFGQARVMVAWQRIVFPDGKALDIDKMPGADSAGYSGFNDKVNNHYFRLFSQAILMSGVTAGISLSQNSGGSTINQQQTAGGAMSEALGQQLGSTTTALINKNLSTSPTLEIRPGYRFNIVVIKDLTFTKPYQSFDY